MQELQRAEIEKFFDTEYKDLFNEIKKRKWYNNNNKLNNYNDEFTLEITKKNFYDFVNEINGIFNDKNIKPIFKNFEFERKKKLLDFIILFTFFIYEIIEYNDMCEKLGYYSTYFILDYLGYYHKERDSYYKYLEKFYFVAKIINLTLFIQNSVDEYGNIFQKKFYDSFYIKDEIKIIVKDFLHEICGICLAEYNDDMISYCGNHFICIECYEEIDVICCINKCETKELLLYKKA